ncbi:MAG: TrmH family RNA methyltransferase [Spirochaetaceae bacterium]|jgi:TrmH family RNA methyltransferase|nr:TrmH family RNA methyltransferase [Spirochaetaceae bacterium]
MIPLHKLKKLPRSQGLRKIAKLLGEAEYRISLGHDISPVMDLPYLEEILGFLVQDPFFPLPAAGALRNIHAGLGGHPGPGNSREKYLRILNTVRHILLSETGRQTADWDLIDHTGRLDPRGRRVFTGMRIYLEDIRSPFNVGAMFRTAESFGAEKIYLSPLCADPNHPRAARTAMGCVDLVPWERCVKEPYLVPNLGPNDSPNYDQYSDCPALPEGPVFALETGGTGIDRFPFPRRALMIVGSEELGVSPQGLAAADASLGRVSIPTYGAKGSLNVSAAFGIVLYAWAAALSHEGATL